MRRGRSGIGRDPAGRREEDPARTTPFKSNRNSSQPTSLRGDESQPAPIHHDLSTPNRADGPCRWIDLLRRVDDLLGLDYCRFARAIEVYDRACLDGDYELDGWARGGDVCAEALKRRVEQVTGLPFAFELAVA